LKSISKPILSFAHIRFHRLQLHLKSEEKSSKGGYPRRAGDVVKADGVVVAGGDQEIFLAVEVEAVYLPGLQSDLEGELVRGEKLPRNRWFGGLLAPELT
jgi:hypothetical protein